MTVTLAPDCTELVIGFLADQTEIEAFFSPPRVYSTMPKTKAWPLVLVEQFNDQPVTQSPQWLDRFSLQISAFGGPKKLAFSVAATCRAVLAERLPGPHPTAVVTAVDLSGWRYQPDDTFEPAQPRWLFVAHVTAHPPPVTGS